MKKIFAMALFSIMTTQTTVWADSLAEQQESLRNTLNFRFKQETLKNIKEIYEKELDVLEVQYQRNKKLEEFQNKQTADIVSVPVFTHPFKFITSSEWDKGTINYANLIKALKVTHGAETELQFSFPEVSPELEAQISRYKINPPKFTVVSVLLSSGKLLKLDQMINDSDHKAVTVATDGAKVLKINLEMRYQSPDEQNAKTVLTRNDPERNGITLLPSFDNVVTLQMDERKANAIVQVDALDAKGNTLSTKVAEKISTINDLENQATRINMIKELINKIDDRSIKNNVEAINFIVEKSIDPIKGNTANQRVYTKTFLGKVSKVLVYTTDQSEVKTYSFSIY